MSYRKRNVVVAAVLAVGLFLASPSPSHAALHPWRLPLLDAWEHARTWLGQLLPGMEARKPGVWTKEGAVIVPDGRTGSGLTTSSGSPAGNGGAITLGGTN